MGNRSGIIGQNVNNTIFYRDITMNLDINPMTKQLAVLTNEQAVIESIKTLIQIAPFEREYENVGGGIVNKLLFEPLDTATSLVLQNAIKNTIENYEPRATLQTVIVNPLYDRNAYLINIAFTMNNIQTPISFEMILERLR